VTAAPATIVQTTLAEAAQALERLRNDSAMLARIEAAGALLADTFAAGARSIRAAMAARCATRCIRRGIEAAAFATSAGLRGARDQRSGHLSCVGNDYGYDQVFARFVRAHARAGDVLLAITTSGSSKNVWRRRKRHANSGRA